MEFIKNSTKKLRNLGRLLTRRTSARNRIAPAPVEVEQRQTLSRSRKSTRRTRASNRIAPASEKLVHSLSPRQSFPSSRQTAARSLQRSVRIARTRAIKREECSICFEPMLYPKTLICGHKFHKKCIDKWTATNPSCPTCRRYIAPETRLSMPISANNTANTISNARVLIERMKNAGTFVEASRLFNDITRIIDSLPRNDVYREVADSQWEAWSHVYRRVALAIPRVTPHNPYAYLAPPNMTYEEALVARSQALEERQLATEALNNAVLRTTNYEQSNRI